MAALLDVNALIALIDRDHVGHNAIHRWFAGHASRGWATCAITENGLVRVLSQPAYPSGQRSPSEVIAIIREVKTARGYEFWNESVSLTDPSLFQAEFITGSRQVTDAYLLGLTLRRNGRVVTFDRTLPWQGIRGGTPQLIEIPE